MNHAASQETTSLLFSSLRNISLTYHFRSKTLNLVLPSNRHKYQGDSKYYHPIYHTYRQHRIYVAFRHFVVYIACF